MLFLVVYGAPAHLKAFALPSACTAYSNVDGQGINLGMASMLTPKTHHRSLVQQQQQQQQQQQAVLLLSERCQLTSQQNAAACYLWELCSLSMLIADAASRTAAAAPQDHLCPNICCISRSAAALTSVPIRRGGGGGCIYPIPPSSAFTSRAL